MDDSSKIKTAIERSKKAITLKPALGRGTGISKARITSGLACEIVEGKWKLVADMPEGVGGDQSGPTPGVYGRAALGSCLAMGYMMRAAELEIPIDSIEVEVQADFDDAALLGVAAEGVPPGYHEIRYTVNIVSDANNEDINRIIEEGDQRSPYLDVFARGQKCVRTINISSIKAS